MARLAAQALDVDRLAEAALDLLLEAGDIDAANLVMVDAETGAVLSVPSRGARRAAFSVDTEVDALALCARSVAGGEVVVHPSIEQGTATASGRLHICHPLRGRRPESGVSSTLAVLHLVTHPTRHVALDEVAALSDLLGLALQSALRLAHVEQQNRVLRGLNDISDLLNQSPRLQETLGQALARILELVHAEIGRVFLRQPNADVFTRAAQQGPPALFLSEDGEVTLGVGEAGLVAASGRTRLWGGADAPRGFFHVAVALQTKGRVLGVLQVGTRAAGGFGAEETAFLERLGGQMGLAVENGLQFQTISDQATRLSRRTRYLTALLETSDQMARSVELERDLASCVQRIGEMMTLAVVLVLLDEGDGHARIVSRFIDRTRGRRARGMRSGLRLAWADLPVAERALRSQHMAAVEVDQAGLGVGEARWMSSNQVRSALVLPLIVNGQSQGALVLASAVAPRVLYPSELDFIRTVANQLAVAIERERLFREVREAARSLEQRVEERTRALREANLRLQEATRQRADFLNVMSHELRTPLNAILGFSELMADPSAMVSMDEVREYSDAVHQSGKSLLTLVNDILDLAHPQASDKGLQRESLLLADVVSGVLDLLRPQALGRGVVLRTTIDRALPRVAADRARVKQILYNLVSNAVKFSPSEGCVTLSAEVVDTVVWVSVDDEGPGIEPALQDRVFEPFFQAEGGLDRAHEGAGLGLSLARRAARLLGGDVVVTSIPGAGSRFRFSLPLEG